MWLWVGRSEEVRGEGVRFVSGEGVVGLGRTSGDVVGYFIGGYDIGFNSEERGGAHSGQ